MAQSKTFASGFVGASTSEAARWVAEQVSTAWPDATPPQRILVPFAGSGKDVAAMAQAAPGSYIASFDVQRLSALNIDGVFAQPGPVRVITRPRFVAGTPDPPTPGTWPAEAVELWHGLARGGSPFERAALVRATVRCSFHGRLTGWKRGVTAFDLWEEFEKACAYLASWTGLPATFKHTEGSFYDHADGFAGSWDVVQVDPPKVVGKADVYSGKSGFAQLNAALGGGEIPPWHEAHVVERLTQVFKVDARRIVFLYAEGLRPDLDVVEGLLMEHGKLVGRREFQHRGRTDVGYVVDKS